MRVCRIIGWILIVLAIATAGYEAVAWLTAKSYTAFAFGTLWSLIDLASLNVFQAAIQRHVWPLLWDGVIIPVLLTPSWVVFGVPGLLIVWACRRRGGERWR